jgi:serine/threonine protein kinase
MNTTTKTEGPLSTDLQFLEGGRYELIERIGRGAAGDVYRAREVGFAFPREVCIKRLAAVSGAEHVRAMREEARLLACVRHCNVVSLLSMGEEPGGGPFLVLELVRGWNLRDLCRKLARAEGISSFGHLPDLVAVHVACGVLRALAAVQRAVPGLVHRDVTPHNVLVSNEGEVKLSDFGIALALDRARWTRPQFIKGKFGFMAPEQIRGERLDVRTDLFAVGVTLYEMLTRTRPWGVLPPMEELRAIESGDIAPLCTYRPKLARSLSSAVDRLLAWKMEDRFPNPDDALRALAPHSAGDLGALRLAALAEEADRQTCEVTTP